MRKHADDSAEKFRLRRVNLSLLIPHSFIHSEQLLGEISEAITTFNWSNSSAPVTVASSGSFKPPRVRLLCPFTNAVINFWSLF